MHVFPNRFVQLKPLTATKRNNESRELNVSRRIKCPLAYILGTTPHRRLPWSEIELHVPLRPLAVSSRTRRRVSDRARQPRGVEAPADERPLRRGDAPLSGRPALRVVLGPSRIAARRSPARLPLEELHAPRARRDQVGASGRNRPRRCQRAQNRAGQAGVHACHLDGAGVMGQGDDIDLIKSGTQDFPMTKAASLAALYNTKAVARPPAVGMASH